MKAIIQILAIILVSYLAELILPMWYGFAIVAFAFGYLIRSRMNFLAGFIAVVLLWAFELWLVDSSAATDFVSRVALFFPPPLNTKQGLIIFTLLVGGLVGGFATLSGALLKPKRRKYEMRYR